MSIQKMKVSLVVSMLCLFSLLTVKANAEDFGVYKGKRKEIILKTEGIEFSVGNKKWDCWLEVKKANTPETISVIGTSEQSRLPYDKRYYFPGKLIEEIKVVVDKEDEKIVYIKAAPDTSRSTEEFDLVSLEMNLRIKKGVPCLFIYQRLTNLNDIPHQKGLSNIARSLFQVYAAKDMVIHDMPVSEKSKEFRLGKTDFTNKTDWIWAKEKVKEEGLGIMSFVPSQFITVGTPDINWGYTGGLLEEECHVEYKAAITVSRTPEAVGALYEKIKEIELGNFLLPGQEVVKLLK